MSIRRLAIATALLLAAAGAFAQTAPADDGFSAADAAWMSYRDAYRQMLRFEKYGKPKHFIQHHFQVVPKDKAAGMEGVRLLLQGRTMQLELPLDAAGRAVFPMSKAAYDENARLALNRKSGQYVFQPRVSIVVRADGVYEAADLRAACEQVLNYLRDSGQAPSGERKCAGVVFSYARNGVEPNVRFRGVDGQASRLRIDEGGAFSDDSTVAFRTVTYSFAEWPEKGQVITQTPPVAIGAVIR